MTTEYSGQGDPARSLALLWRTPGKGRVSRKGKPELSVDLIVRAAIEVGDADGLAALSMRRVAERLGVGTMSLYTYVPGKAELIDVMLDTVYGDLYQAAPAGGWRERLESIAREQWALYHRHPWLLQVATGRPTLGPNAMAKYEFELAAVEGIGLSDLEMDSVVTLVYGYVHGAARGAVEASRAPQETGMTDEQWWQTYAPLLNSLVDQTRFPIASRVGTAAGQEHGAAYNPGHAFEFGLARVLDGIQTLVVSLRGG
ncbi:TetR/AcrR family transcriptional regulator [Acrocarpospora macrocephala]|uniref:TetR family transcriptional regulator n=1 Tax=Acrocarpospora macrocephala TaxID=150177 RepID=A0A5M3WMH9_9ACTN|nr:TetR/AcrR family transcriptional regulator [Acrocarpospora macrocephala]GES10485.1 TetR family transcriptional regulator [Acrocarpospora macrocephala]